MTADNHPENETTEHLAARVADVLFAADVRRLVQASRDNDDETVSEIRQRYLTE